MLYFAGIDDCAPVSIIFCLRPPDPSWVRVGGPARSGAWDPLPAPPPLYAFFSATRMKPEACGHSQGGSGCHRRGSSCQAPDVEAPMWWEGPSTSIGVCVVGGLAAGFLILVMATEYGLGFGWTPALVVVAAAGLVMVLVDVRLDTVSNNCRSVKVGSGVVARCLLALSAVSRSFFSNEACRCLPLCCPGFL